MQAFLGFHYFYSSFCLSLQDCLLGSARCVLFQCPLHNFSGQAVLKINARLWNSSFIEVKKTTKKPNIIVIITSVIPYGRLRFQLASAHIDIMEVNDG